MTRSDNTELVAEKSIQPFFCSESGASRQAYRDTRIQKKCAAIIDTNKKTRWQTQLLNNAICHRRFSQEVKP